MSPFRTPFSDALAATGTVHNTCTIPQGGACTPNDRWRRFGNEPHLGSAGRWQQSARKMRESERTVLEREGMWSKSVRVCGGGGESEKRQEWWAGREAAAALLGG